MTYAPRRTPTNPNTNAHQHTRPEGMMPSDHASAPPMMPDARECAEAAAPAGASDAVISGIAAEIEQAYGDGWNAHAALAESRARYEEDHRQLAEVMYRERDKLREELAESRAEVARLTERAALAEGERVAFLKTRQHERELLGDPRKGVHVPPADWGLPQNATDRRRSPAATGEDDQE